MLKNSKIFTILILLSVSFAVSAYADARQSVPVPRENQYFHKLLYYSYLFSSQLNKHSSALSSEIVRKNFYTEITKWFNNCALSQEITHIIRKYQGQGVLQSRIISFEQAANIIRNELNAMPIGRKKAELIFSLRQFASLMIMSNYSYTYNTQGIYSMAVNRQGNCVDRSMIRAFILQSLGVDCVMAKIYSAQMRQIGRSFNMPSWIDEHTHGHALNADKILVYDKNNRSYKWVWAAADTRLGLNIDCISHIEVPVQEASTKKISTKYLPYAYLKDPMAAHTISDPYYVFARALIDTSYADTFAENNKTEKAIQLLYKVIKYAPDFPNAYAYLGELYMDDKQYIRALIYFNRALKIQPKFITVYAGRAEAYLCLGQNFKAERDFSTVLRFDPGYKGQIHWFRGLAYYLMNKHIEAVSDFTRAIQLDRDNAQIYCYRAQAYIVLNNIKSAFSDLCQAIKYDPKHAEAYYIRGLIYTDHGQYSEAMSDLKKAIELKPDYTEARQKLRDVKIKYRRRGYIPRRPPDFKTLPNPKNPVLPKQYVVKNSNSCPVFVPAGKTRTKCISNKLSISDPHVKIYTSYTKS